jgi:hypothetical protein
MRNQILPIRFEQELLYAVCWKMFTGLTYKSMEFRLKIVNSILIYFFSVGCFLTKSL